MSAIPTPVLADNSNYAAFYVNIIIGSLGLIGNAFVCLVMLRYRSIFNSTTNKLIIHQSVVDFLGSLLFLLGVVIPPPSQVPDNILGSMYCKLWWSEWLQYSVFIVSTYNLVAISVERYFATCQPVRHRNMFSSHRLMMVVALDWISICFLHSYLIFISHNIDGVCEVIWPSPTIQAVVGVVIVESTIIVIPLAIIIYSYIKIILALYKRSRARVGDNNQDARNMLTRANKNVTLTLFVVAIFFAICWTPISTSYMLYNLGLNETFVSPTLNAIVVLNICINPFIYCFTYERFQKQVKKMVCGGRRRNDNRVDTISGSTRQEATAQHPVQLQMTAAVSVFSSRDNPAVP